MEILIILMILSKLIYKSFVTAVMSWDALTAYDKNVLHVSVILFVLFQTKRSHH